MIENKYVVLKSNWGIVVQIFGDIVEYNESFEGKKLMINERLFLKCDNTYSSSPRQLGKREESIIQIVIDGMAESIIASSCYTKTLIRILGLAFTELDYQEEGLIVAMMQWISKAFNLKMPDIPVYYDNKQNRYIFNFDELNKYPNMKDMIEKLQEVLENSQYPFMS